VTLNRAFVRRADARVFALYEALGSWRAVARGAVTLLGGAKKNTLPHRQLAKYA
jgi:hypothetical protein